MDGAAGLRRARPRARRNDRALRAVSRRSATRLFRERCTGTNRRDAGRGRGRLGREHRPARPRGRRGGDRPTRLHQGGLPAPHDRAGHLCRRRRHRAPYGRTRGRARGLPRRDQCHRRSTEVLPAEVSPLGSFTDPEYASVGLTEATARETHDVVVGKEDFASMPRPIIDGRPTGFCKLVVDRERHTILGCHIVGERAVELAQLAALAVASGMKVEQLALVPFSFPTYANALGRAAIRAARQLDSRSSSADGGWHGTPAPPPPSMTEALSVIAHDRGRFEAIGRRVVAPASSPVRLGAAAPRSPGSPAHRTARRSTP